MRPEMKFVGRMRALFGPPDADADAVIDEYVNALAGQTAATLDKAADHLARTHKFRNWPTVAECLDAVSLAKKRVNSSAMGLEPIDNFDAWWSERLARIRIAKTEKHIETEIREIEPYAIAGWIASHRLPDALSLAKQVRDGWKVKAADERAQRVLGERE